MLACSGLMLPPLCIGHAMFDEFDHRVMLDGVKNLLMSASRSQFTFFVLTPTVTSALRRGLKP